jgi:uncharacterized protein (TIGR02145 family)
MKKTITVFALFTVVVLLFSCRNRSDKALDSKASYSEQTTSGSGENKNSAGPETAEQGPDIVIDIDGNVYETVKINRQTWMVKNLKTTKYNDGTAIPLVTDEKAWAALSSPGYCWYNNDSLSYKPTYGALYNWYAVNTGKLCPMNWHVPSDEEWTSLITWLGGEVIAGNKLKETGTDFWVGPNTGATNEFGFSALPGGFRYQDGIFHDFGFSGYWWTSTKNSDTRAFFRYMDYEYSNVFRFNNLNKNGFSVRCIRDY